MGGVGSFLVWGAAQIELLFMAFSKRAHVQGGSIPGVIAESQTSSRSSSSRFCLFSRDCRKFSCKVLIYPSFSLGASSLTVVVVPSTSPCHLRGKQRGFRAAKDILPAFERHTVPLCREIFPA